MKLYNTLSRQIELLQPLRKNKVNLFVCGPTVYGLIHIGNAKTYVQFDLLARVLRDQGLEVYYLQNITDVDDKIIAKAKEQNISWQKLSHDFEKEYFKDIKELNITSVDYFARATDYIQDMIAQIQKLLKKGHAYQINDGIYFEISTFTDYGKLSGRTQVEQDDAESRIDHSNNKKGWNDFCLWKFSKPGEPIWEAPFGAGRPGWHIEDTAITEHHFGPQYDIHGGAIDLIFPHHEAEITQMESASGKVPLVKHWVHTGFLKIDDNRMGKSLGNFFTVQELLRQGYDPIDIRLMMLQTHYRSSINFSFANLVSATQRLNGYRQLADYKWQTHHSAMDISERLSVAKQNIRDALANDLNTAEALAELSKLQAEVTEKGVSSQNQSEFSNFLNWLDNVFGLDLSNRPDISKEDKLLLQSREQARSSNDWTKSDKIREEFAKQNIVIKDTDLGPIWCRN
jgi:cysteinyl-tRNA synthetase